MPVKALKPRSVSESGTWNSFLKGLPFKPQSDLCTLLYRHKKRNLQDGGYLLCSIRFVVLGRVVMEKDILKSAALAYQ